MESRPKSPEVPVYVQILDIGMTDMLMSLVFSNIRLPEVEATETVATAVVMSVSEEIAESIKSDVLRSITGS